MIVSRLETPGLFSGSKTISRPASVTAERIFFALGSRLLEQVQAAGAAQALAHLLLRPLQVEDLGGRLDDVRLGHDEALAEARVETLRQVAGQLEMLALVLPTGTRAASYSRMSAACRIG